MANPLKTITQHLLIKALGFRRYLFLVAEARIRTMALLGYEEDFLFFAAMIPKGCVILDIGANIGVTTFFLARTNPDCVVHSFEPVPDNLDSLERVVSRFKLDSVVVHRCGLGDRPGKIPMIMPVIGGIPRHALCQVDDGHSKYHNGIRFEVEIKRLDEIAGVKDSPNVKAIKIDVENFEFSALSGGLDLIRRCRPVIFCELSDDKARVIDLLDSLGYTRMRYEQGTLGPVEKTNSGGGNYFFIPQEGVPSVRITHKSV
ncbi:MAG: FkbM family methyltransferase [Vicinamibacterales bacterium]